MTVCADSINFIQKRINFQREKISQLIAEREKIFEAYKMLIHNFDVQIVLRRGLVEIPLSGDLSDFADAILIRKSEIYKINKLIKVSLAILF